MGLTTDVKARHDDHTENPEGFVPVVCAHDGSEAEAGRVFSWLASWNSKRR